MIFRHLSRFLGSIQKNSNFDHKTLNHWIFCIGGVPRYILMSRFFKDATACNTQPSLRIRGDSPVVAILAPGLPHAVALKLMGRHSLLVFLRALHLKKCLWKCVEGCLLILSQLLNKRLCNAIGPWFESMPLLHPAHKDSEVRIQLCCSPFRLPAGHQEAKAFDMA